MASEQDNLERLLLADSAPEHFHSGWLCCDEARRLAAYRVLHGLCVIVSHPEGSRPYGLWCLTHACEENYGHELDRRDKVNKEARNL